MEMKSFIPKEGIQFVNKGVELFDRGFLYFYVCHPGEISFVAKARNPNFYLPNLVVALHNQTLWSGEISGTEELTFNIPTPGWFTLSLSDRYYNPPNIQSLSIQNLHFQAQRNGIAQPKIYNINIGGE